MDKLTHDLAEALATISKWYNETGDVLMPPYVLDSMSYALIMYYKQIEREQMDKQ